MSRIVENVALAVMKAAHEDEKDARRTRAQHREREVTALQRKADENAKAAHEETDMNVTRSKVAFVTSFFGALGTIGAEITNFAVDETEGHQVADMREQADLAQMRATIARSKGDDAKANLEARQREADRAQDKALDLSGRAGEAVKIA